LKPAAFFDGVRQLMILGLTRSDPYSDPLGRGRGILKFG